MPAKAHCICRVNFPDRKSLEIILNALKPEVMKPTTVRSRATLETSGTSLVLQVEAKDTVALRAALNAYLRWINSMMNVLKVLTQEPTKNQALSSDGPNSTVRAK